MSGDVFGTLKAIIPNSSFTATLIPTPSTPPNPMTYLDLWDKIQKEGQNNPRIEPTSNIMLYNIRTKTWKSCVNYPTLKDLHAIWKGTTCIAKVSTNEAELDFNGIKIGYNVIDVASVSNGTIHIRF